jgi:thiosulfate reductase cytochrome b subunit
MSTSDPAYVQELAAPSLSVSDFPRHSLTVRVTHWITALSFVGLLVSGIAILLSHPRLYWGETGNVATPALIDLPIPFVLENQNGWGRYLHFLSAWIVVINGVAYILFGLVTRHFRKNLLPAKADLNWNGFARVLSSLVSLKRRGHEESRTYNVLQQVSYLIVIFALFPFVIWTGLAMSPALTSVVPALVTFLGGHQSARTLHFFVAALLVLFVFIHVVMVWLAGFGKHVRAMVTGYGAARKEHA